MSPMTAVEARGALIGAVLLVLAALPGAPPRDAPAVAARPPAAPAATGVDRVDLNRADAAELTALPGIGPVLAERIVAHRRRHGRFETLDDLAAVRGIGPRLIERVRTRAGVGVEPDSLLR